MNGIDDLRRTLEDHAGGPDDRLSGRGAAVHGRVAAVRRRRLAAVAIAAAGVLAVWTVVLGPGDDDLPVAGTLAGAEAPATMSSLGYTYRYADGAEGDRTVTLEVPESDEPRLVTWATSGADDTVTVESPAQDVVVWDGPDFSRWTILPGGVGGTVKADVGSGEVALASYTLAVRPANITDPGVVFRDVVAGQSLILAAVGAPGSASVATSGKAVGSLTGVHYFCAGAPKGAWFTLSINGKDVSGGYCDTGVVPIDAAGNSASHAGLPGDPVNASLSVTAGEDGPPLQDGGDLQVGIGLYDDPSAGTPLGGDAGLEFDDVVESGGHRWQLDDTTIAPVGTARLDTPLPTDRGPILVSVLADADLDTTVVVDFGTPATRSLSLSLGGGGGTTQIVGVGGGTVTMKGERPTDQLRLGSALYVLAD